MRESKVLVVAVLANTNRPWSTRNRLLSTYRPCTTLTDASKGGGLIPLIISLDYEKIEAD